MQLPQLQLRRIRVPRLVIQVKQTEAMVLVLRAVSEALSCDTTKHLVAKVALDALATAVIGEPANPAPCAQELP